MANLVRPVGFVSSRFSLFLCVSQLVLEIPEENEEETTDFLSGRTATAGTDIGWPSKRRRSVMATAVYDCRSTSTVHVHAHVHINL